ncbi:MAG: DUF2062 domain-containing protein [Planctomycetota bacterium]|nr:DUF2062 domain-containing protein [Planctomycetota bacterium]
MVSLGRFLREKIVDPVRRAQGTPESIARGSAVGMFIALTPTVGVQSLLVTACALPLRGNLPVALVMCWITNPITLIPFYFAYYWLGALLLGLPMASYTTIAERIGEQFALLPELGFIDSMAPLGTEILWPMFVGSLVLATVTTWITYHLMLWLIRRQRAGRDLVQATAGGGAAENAPNETTIQGSRDGGEVQTGDAVEERVKPTEGEETLMPGQSSESQPTSRRESFNRE